MKLICFIIDIFPRRYSRAEQEEMVKYVVRHGAYSLLKGTALWKTMEENGVKQSIIHNEPFVVVVVVVVVVVLSSMSTK
jgi:hypothetical protein